MQKLDSQKRRQPSGYWRDWSNFKRELKNWIERLGHFPNATELKNLKQSSLRLAFYYFGGTNAVRTKLGFTPLRNPRGYWKSWNNVENELQKLTEKLGHFPTQGEIEGRNKSSLASAITKIHGGYPAVQKRFGLTPKQHKKNFWRDWINVEHELRKLIEKLGHFPTKKEIFKSKLPYAIHTHHGGMRKVRDRLNYEQVQITPYYWHKWENVERELKKLIENLGRFPTHTDFAQTPGFKSLPRDIKYHGGIRAVRARIGFGPVTVELLKLYAEPLVKTFFALQAEQPKLTLAAFFEAVTHWTTKQLNEAILALEKGKEINAFQKLIENLHT